MSANKFKFVSPGVFLSEIDNSQIPKTPGGVGPVIIGRARKGPAMRPVKINSYEQFINQFGAPLPGNEGEDAWRDGNGLLAPAYGPYAAQAYLRAAINSPVTYIRLHGVAGDDADSTSTALPGWKANKAYGIFVAVSGSSAALAAASGTENAVLHTASLAGVLYTKEETDSIRVGIRGETIDGKANELYLLSASFNDNGSTPNALINKPIVLTEEKFTIHITDSTVTAAGEVTEEEVSFKRSHGQWIRKVLNTNPVLTNTRLGTPGQPLQAKYWLGQTFEEEYERLVRLKDTMPDSRMMVYIMKLKDEMADFESTLHEASPARSGWIISQNTKARDKFDAAKQQKLFRFLTINDGELANRIFVEIKNIRIPDEGATDPFGKFDVVVKEISIGGDITEVRTFTNCNLNPNSDSFIARQIGDQYYVWDSNEKRNKVYGDFPQTNRYIRVELDPKVGQNGPPNREMVPFGYLGLPQPADQQSANGSKAGDGQVFDAALSWVTGNLAVSGGTQVDSRFSVQWPSLPLVDYVEPGAAQIVFGASPYIQDLQPAVGNAPAGAKDLEETNPGYVDYLRKAPSFSALLTDQNAGTSTAGSATKYSHLFTLDDIWITGASDITEYTGDLDRFDITAIKYLSGSHRGLPGASGASAIAAATASLLITIGSGSADVGGTSTGTTVNGAQLDGLKFRLEDTSGRGQTFTFSNTLTNTGSVIGLLGADLDIADHSAHADGNSPIAQLIRDSINTVSTTFGGSVEISASMGRMPNTNNVRDNAVVVHQLRTGEAGNRVVSGSNALLAYPSDLGILFSPNVGLDFEAAGTIGTHQTASFQGGSNGAAGIAASDARNAYTALSVGSAKKLLDKVDGFRVPLGGGCDGVDITEADPFNMDSAVMGSQPSTRSSYAYASIDRAIELIKSPESIEFNLACMPGITQEALTTKLVRTCENRADALAIIDLPNVYHPPHQTECATFQARLPDDGRPSKVASELVKRQLNSSYGAAYYPWVKIRDVINTRDVWVPPSTVALGVMGYTEERDKVWFAPAGFNRGGLSEGNSGLPVLQVSHELLSAQRDKLYEANINPIASFVSEGLVIFGQKTLQSTPSALDRINVRRLLIFIKKEISRIANRLLFDQNLPATWNRFTGLVNPKLEEIKTGLGLTDFRVILDPTTTTPDLIDRNIMYAKIFLKPARSIEFIAVDFIITRTGASFDD